LRFYCCGPTVYGPAHIGNFRTFLIQDVFRRTVEATGLKTKHVRNITDIDDKTIRHSQEQGKGLVEFTTYWKEYFEKDCEKLNVLTPHVVPSALKHIPEQIELIQSLVERGLAYQASDQSVYFRIKAFPRYGKLSGLKMEDQLENADGRLNTSDEYSKEAFADFALWKAWKPEDGPNKWNSPWGPGRPGWHIECSAMSMKYLGHSFDLHSGGVDLIFPHHENEIAQSEGSTDKQFVRHWFHVAHLRVDGSKMSKSLGNLYTLEDIEGKGYRAEELRYVLVSGHYRQPLNFTFDSLNAARSALTKLQKFKEKIGAKIKLHKNPELGAFEPVLEALTDDLNVSKALGKLFSIIQELDKLEKAKLATHKQGFEQIMYALGLKFDTKLEEEAVEVPEAIQKLAQARWEAKRAKDWEEADRLRGELQNQGWAVKDSKDGFVVSKL
ncbi:MAG: cysteine--tRNA ligase, partial [Opitutales bacterium]|nr:cysteine--tRNA ligase [Opitutales bacterium]